MRTTPIIDIIRKYGLTSKRLNPRNRIKYEDAINAVKQYENSELRIDDVVDNTRRPSHNNCHCGLPGCGQRIRYEYILKSKTGTSMKSDEELVAGSTCVWPTLGLSELGKKDFFKMDQAIRDHYALLDWKDENQDILDKLEKLKENKVYYFKAFWTEVESAPLLDADAEFIRKVDVDKEVERVQYGRKFKEVEDSIYQKAIGYLPELVKYQPDNNFIRSLNTQVESGRKLTGSQFRWLKVLVNRMWYDKNVRGTKKDIYNECDNILKDLLDANNFSTSDFNSIDRVEVEIENMNNSQIKWAWQVFKIKKAIVH